MKELCLELEVKKIVLVRELQEVYYVGVSLVEIFQFD
jgi:hypothetical protein